MRAIVPVQMDLGQEVTLATEELFGHGQEDDVSVVSWRSFKLPRKIAGSNNGETQALVLTNPSGWSVWPALRCTVLRCVAGIWTKQSDKWAVCSSQILEVYFDALRKSESPQLRLRSSRTGEEARGIKEQCAVSDARIHWVDTSTMLADSLTKTGYPARAVMESFLVKKRWRCTFDPTFESGRRRKARGAPVFSQEDLDEINPSTDSVAFDTLLQDESLTKDVREIMRMKYG